MSGKVNLGVVIMVVIVTLCFGTWAAFLVKLTSERMQFTSGSVGQDTPPPFSIPLQPVSP